MILLQKQIITK